MAEGRFLELMSLSEKDSFQEGGSLKTFMTVNYEGALTKIQADQILSNFLGKAKVTEKIFSFEYIDMI